MLLSNPKKLIIFDFEEIRQSRCFKVSSTTLKKEIMKTMNYEGCGREQKFGFCFDRSVRIFCSICPKTSQVNLGPCIILIRFTELILVL